MHEHAHEPSPRREHTRGFADMPRLSRGRFELSDARARPPMPAPGAVAGEPPTQGRYRAPRWQEYRGSRAANSAQPAAGAAPRLPELGQYARRQFPPHPPEQQTNIRSHGTPLSPSDEQSLQWRQARESLAFPHGPAGSRGVAAGLKRQDMSFPDHQNPVHAAAARARAEREAAFAQSPPDAAVSPAMQAGPGPEPYLQPPPEARRVPDRLPGAMHATAAREQRSNGGRAWLAAAAAFALGVIGMASFHDSGPAGTVLGGGGSTQPGVNLPYGAGGIPSPSAAESLQQERADATGGGAAKPTRNQQKKQQKQKQAKKPAAGGGGGAVTVPGSVSERDAHAVDTPSVSGGGPAPEDVPEASLPLTTPAAPSPGNEPLDPGTPF